MTPFVAFGYRKTKTDKHKLEIDPSAGSVVQDIFKMKLRGMSQDAIANRLNDVLNYPQVLFHHLNIKSAAAVIMKLASGRKSRHFGVLLQSVGYWKTRFISEILCREKGQHRTIK